jgi:cytosine/adenosine deaminase-related metal-dependent hydrolase
MSQLDAVGAGLKAMIGDVDHAQTDAAAAEERARDVIERMAAAGFDGIVQGMTIVENTIGQLRQGLHQLGQQVQDTTEPITTAGTDPSPEKTIATLTPVADHLDAASSLIGQLRHTADEARRLTAQVLEGGEPGPLLSQLEGVDQQLASVEERRHSTATVVSETIAEARKAGAAQGN